MPALPLSSAGMADKCRFRHFMLKEINEQPETAALWVARHLPKSGPLVVLPVAAEVMAGVQRIQILACGAAGWLSAGAVVFGL